MRVAIIGASGKMGRWCARFLLKEGHQVLLVGRDMRKLAPLARSLKMPATTRYDDLSDDDVLLLSVPIDRFEEVVRQLSPHVKSQKTVVEITSVKTAPIAALHRHLKTDRILAVHPMFGPGARGVSGQNFALTPTSPTEAAIAAQAKAFLEARGARVTVLTPEEHDRMMAIALALPHLVALVTADTLLKIDPAQNTAALGGSSFKLLRMLVERVITEDPDFYASLQMALPDAPRVHKAFQEALGEWTGRVTQKDSAGFAAVMAGLKERWAGRRPDFARAYDDMYRLLEKQPPQRRPQRKA